MEHSHRNTAVERVTSALQPGDLQTLSIIREITGRGNDAEVRKKRDGTLAVYEIKRNIVPAR